MEASASVEIKRITKKIVLDNRVFKECQAKEVELWSWTKMRNEKWVVHWAKKWHYKKIS